MSLKPEIVQSGMLNDLRLTKISPQAFVAHIFSTSPSFGGLSGDVNEKPLAFWHASTFGSFMSGMRRLKSVLTPHSSAWILLDTAKTQMAIK